MPNGMERLVAALQGEKSDRIPVFCNLLDQGAKELGITLQEYYSNGALVAEAQLRMRQRYGHDNVWSLFYVGKEAELLGCKKIRYAKDGPPNVEDYVIKTYADIERLVIPPDITQHPAFDAQEECLKILRAEVGGKYPICAYITGSMTLPALLMGMEKWMDLLMFGPPELRDQLLEKCNDFCVQEIAAMRARGVDVLVYSNPFGSTDIIPMKFFNEMSLPWMKRDLAPGGMGGMVYYCGMARFNRVIRQVIQELGFSVFYLSPLDDINEGVQLIGDQGLTCGVINDIPLIDWSPTQIRDEVRRLITAGRVSKRFLFGTGVMPYAISETSIQVMLEAAYEYGSF